VKIRLAKSPSDLDIIDNLQKACLPHDTLCDTSVGWWWIAWDDRLPVGFCGYRESVNWKRCGYLCRCGVIPSHRGQGLQKKFIRSRLSHAKRQGMDWMITDTYRNPASANSLIACGFRMYEPADPWSYATACYWRKFLGDA
jgi:GNAT superfamily N-acetyltransferase